MKHSLLFISALLILTACSGAKEKLGFNRQSPDEFSVARYQPLTMPPDYTLRPPRPGAPRPQSISNDEQARATLLGTEPSSALQRSEASANLSSGERLLLDKAEADRAPADIRQIVDAESAATPKNETVSEKIFGWAPDGGKENDDLINPKKEVERLRSQE